jgi:hypothetical protein
MEKGKTFSTNKIFEMLKTFSLLLLRGNKSIFGIYAKNIKLFTMCVWERVAKSFSLSYHLILISLSGWRREN